MSPLLYQLSYTATVCVISITYDVLCLWCMIGFRMDFRSFPLLDPIFDAWVIADRKLSSSIWV